MKFENTGERLAPGYANRFLKKRKTLETITKTGEVEEPEIAKYELNDFEMDPKTVYRIIHDELELNSKPTLNMATFVNTWMEDEAQKLAVESMGVNLIDQSIYPMTTELQKRCVSMMALKLGAKYDPLTNDYIGTTTIGSSEAVMLGILAHKTRWMEAYDKLPQKPKAGKVPNLVIGGAYQICWEKVYKFFDLAGMGDPSLPDDDPRKKRRIIDLEGERRIVTAEAVKKCIAEGIIDDNTVAVGLMLGTTLTGEMDEVVEINAVIKEYNDKVRDPKKIPRLAIHVDAAYSGFVLPFTESNFHWDFKASEVMSINISNHKFGLVYPGLGTVVFRDPSVVPASLKTTVDYLGKPIYDYALNFSRASSQVICQYYNFLRFGEPGYHKIMKTILKNASLLAEGLLEIQCQVGGRLIPCFELLTTHQKDKKTDEIKVRLPNIVIRFHPATGFAEKEAKALTNLLKVDGWSVPSYKLPKNLDKVWVLRMVVKENFSEDLVKLFLTSMKNAVDNMTRAAVMTNDAADTDGRHVIC